jgi:hypothetical protein
MRAMRQYNVMTQPFPYEDEVALCEEECNNAYDLLPNTRQRVYYEPDEEFYNSLSGEEFTRRALEMVKRVHEKYGKK